MIAPAATGESFLPRTSGRAQRSSTRTVGPDPEAQLAQALDRYAGLQVAAFVPYDRAGCDAMLSAGRLLAECAPASPIRAVLGNLAAELAGLARPNGHRLRRLWRASA